MAKVSNQCQFCFSLAVVNMKDVRHFFRRRRSPREAALELLRL